MFSVCLSVHRRRGYSSQACNQGDRWVPQSGLWPGGVPPVRLVARKYPRTGVPPWTRQGYPRQNRGTPGQDRGNPSPPPPDKTGAPPPPRTGHSAGGTPLGHGRGLYCFMFYRFEQKLWIATMFTGCATVYAARTAVPLCIVAISKEMNWDKKQSVRWTIGWMIITCKNL